MINHEIHSDYSLSIRSNLAPSLDQIRQSLTDARGWSLAGAALVNRLLGVIDHRGTIQEMKNLIDSCSDLSEQDASHLTQAGLSASGSPSNLKLQAIRDFLTSNSLPWSPAGAALKDNLFRAMDHGSTFEALPDFINQQDASQLTRQDIRQLNEAGLSTSSSQSTPIPSAYPPAKPGYLPVVLNPPKDKSADDVYVRIQGTDPKTNSLCYLTFDANGMASYHDIPNNTPGNADGSQYCVKLSSLPKFGDGYLIYTLPIESGRILISVDKPTIWQDPDMNNASDPDTNINWSMVELTTRDNPNPTPANPNGIWSDYSGVDFVGMPMQLQTHTNDGKPDQIHGYDGNRQALINKALELLKQYDTTPGQVWNHLCQYDGAGNVLRILAAKHMLAPLGNFPNNYFQDYLEKTFLPYFASNNLQVDASGANGNPVETYTGNAYQDSSDGKWYFKFVGQTDGNVVIVPAETDNASAWLTGASGPWPDTKNPVPNTNAFKDLIRDLSAIANAGIKPEAMQGQLIDKQWMIDARNKGEYYQAPVYNVYDRAMHEAGLNAYAYDYDDRLGQDGTEGGPFDGSCIAISLPDLSSPSPTPPPVESAIQA